MAATEKPTLLIIDGHSLAFRAFFALLPAGRFVTSEGQHTEVPYGFITSLLKFMKDEKPTHVAVAFDISRYSFRTREYEAYKDGRGETPPEFIGQVPLLQEALDAMRIKWLVKEDYEADDILATLATRGEAAGYEVLVVSGDRDAFQLVSDGVTVLYPSTLGVGEFKRYDAAAVHEKYKVWPEQYPELAALVGEKADNLPGITKVGPVTAAKWIAQWGTVEEILAHADEIPGVAGQNLRAERENAIRNRRLNALVRDLELEYSLDELTPGPIDEAALRSVFRKLEFNTLLDRVLKSGPVEAADGGEETDREDARLPAEPPIRTLVDEELANWLAPISPAGGPSAAVQVATESGSLEGIGLAVDADSAWVPWGAHRPDYEALERYLADADAAKVLFAAKRQWHALAGQGIAIEGIEGDPTIAAWLLEPWAKSGTLAAAVQHGLGEQIPEPDRSQLVPEHEPLNAATQAWYGLRLERAVVERLDERSRAVYAEIEIPLVPVLARMERQGVAVDRPRLEGLSTRLRGQASEIAQQAYAEIGREVNLGSPKQLQEVLFDQLGMPKTRANKTGYSTDAEALADLQESNPHPFLDLLLRHRDATKLAQMVDTLVAAIDPDGRIHTTYEQTGAASGRLSSNDPNLQNIPARTATGQEIRTAFRAGEGFESLLTADYSQIEMRIMAHLSGDEGLIEAFRSGEDLHRFVGARIFGIDPGEVTAEQRVKVKAMSYGLAYGLSAFGLARQLRIDRAEAQALMKDYFERFGGIRDYLRSVVAQAKVDGYTTTLFGRRRPFPDFTSSNRVLRDNAERAALNSPIQGTAADIIKRAMIAIDQDIVKGGLDSRMLLQVHDELVFEVAPGELDILRDIVTNRMSTAAQLSVPLDVQVGVGPDWDAAGH